MKRLAISSGEICFRLVNVYWARILPFTGDGFGVYHLALACWRDPKTDRMAQDITPRLC